jgi:hypothetical protein
MLDGDGENFPLAAPFHIRDGRVDLSLRGRALPFKPRFKEAAIWQDGRASMLSLF